MKTLKSSMLRHTATLKQPASISAWQTPQSPTTTPLSRVHVQRTGRHPTLWYDAKLSRPHNLNLPAMQAQAKAAGTTLFVTYDNREYAVTRIAEHPNGFGRIHHYELELT